VSSAPGAGSAIGRGEIRIGISSWGSLPGFYPAKIKSSEKLIWYARFFDVVEVNVSYYRLVPPRTYDQWIDATPDAFTFDVKAFGELTHFRERPPDQTFVDFRASFQPLRESGRLGGVLFQFPPRFGNTPGSRAYLQRVAAMMAGDLTIVEFRNFSWLSPENASDTFALLSELNLAYAIADEPQIPNDTVPPLPAVTNPNLAYVRLHGRNAKGWYREGGGSRYDYDYSDAELFEVVGIIDGLTAQARAVHVMFNNNARGDGTRNALELARRLGISPAEAPELPLEQTRLFDVDE
jgi:uncharacterized protein YecE (DUF72 family)